MSKGLTAQLGERHHLVSQLKSCQQIRNSLVAKFISMRTVDEIRKYNLLFSVVSLYKSFWLFVGLSTMGQFI